MNWKTNYWTLLFALALGALVLSLSDHTTLLPGRAGIFTNVQTCSPDIIPKIQATAAINAYVNNWIPHLPPADSTLKYDSLSNPNVRYFYLDPCELHEILKKDSVSLVFANLRWCSTVLPPDA